MASFMAIEILRESPFSVYREFSVSLFSRNGLHQRYVIFTLIIGHFNKFLKIFDSLLLD